MFDHEKLKKNVASTTGAMDKLLKLKPVDYDYKTDEFAEMNLPSGKQHGLLANDVELILPELVSENAHLEFDKDRQKVTKEVTFKCLNYNGLIPLLIGAIQEQQKQIEELKTELAKK
jgi:hypothetical protein